MTFEERYSVLNKEQRQAVDAIEGPIMVIAGPGTGKTTILTLRIANILKKTDVPAEAILALTFTESGVRAMRKKLSEVIGPVAYKVKIHTFHSFANDVIKTYPDKFPRIIGAEHVEGLEQIALVEKIINDNDFEILRPKGAPVYYVTKIINAIKELKRENVSADDFKKLVNKEEKDILSSVDLKHRQGKYIGKIKGKYHGRLEDVAKDKELLEVYRMYEKALEKAKLYDFEDMITEVVKKLENDENLRLRIQEENQYILADEHQDANMAQNKLLEIVASFHENPNLFIVGDEKQAIFRFQGASLENFLYFKRRFPEARLIRLFHNYRSHQTILDASHSLILNNRAGGEDIAKIKNQHTSLRAARHTAIRKISCFSFPNRRNELAFISSETKKLLETGISPSEIAILVRNNNHAEAIERALSAKAVPVARFADFNALDHPYSESFFSLARAIVNPTDDEAVGKAMLAPFLNLDVPTISKCLSLWRKDKGNLIEFAAEDPVLKNFADLVLKLSRLASGEPLVETFETIVSDAGFVEFILKNKNARELVPLYATLLDTVVRFAERDRTATLRDFLEHLNHAKEHDYDISVSFSPPEGVNLMTAHGSKGLEFEYVFIVHASDGVWGGKRIQRAFNLPGFFDLAEKENSEDERRLFYVALTRAKNHVFITYSDRNAEAQELSPSRFISEIQADFIEHKKQDSTFEISLSRPIGPSLLKDKQYLKKLFLERGFAVTHLNNYLRCPWLYFFVNLLQLPKSQSNAELYGSAVHAALHHYFESYKKEDDISIDSVLDLFENHLRRTHMTEKDLKEHIKSGRREIKTYLSTHKFSRLIWNEFKIIGVPLQVGRDQLRLMGNLDKVELLHNGKVNVVDYKTGRPKSRNFLLGKTQDADGDYRRQLVFYKLLLDRYKKGEWQMETGTIDFIRPDNSNKLRREVFEISSGEVSELEKLIAKTAEEIINFSFGDKECEDKKCQWCKLKNMITANSI